MVPYLDTTRKSGGEAYEFGADFIAIKFKGSPRIYKYSYQRAGMKHVMEMKFCAEKGHGLNAYINKYAKNLYDRYDY